MARDDRLRFQGHAGRDASRTCIEDLIRPGLRQAFPLPSGGHANDDRFGQLLEALARRCGRSDGDSGGRA